MRSASILLLSFLCCAAALRAHPGGWDPAFLGYGSASRVRGAW